MVFCFREQELTLTIEELESFLDWKHCHDIGAVFPVHKPSYFKDFHMALGLLKDSLPKEALEECLHSSFDLILERSWKMVGDFIDPTKFKAFTLLILGQLILSHSRHHISGVLCDILMQHLQKKMLAPVIISKTTTSLSHCAQHRRGRLYDCLAFLKAWLHEHVTTLSSFPTYVSRHLAPA